MLDSESTSTLFALAAEFLKTKREEVSERNAQAFATWLEHEAFPAVRCSSQSESDLTQ